MTMDIAKMSEQRTEWVTKARAMVDAADAEGRELSVEEARNYQDYMGHAEQLRTRIEREEELRKHEEEFVRSHQEPTRPELSEREVAGTPTKFRSFGEQAQAVLRAARPGGFVDPRLTLRAVMGMSEGSPSDGGFLVQQDFSAELLKRTYNTAVVANRCRRIQLSNNSNSLKINAIAETSRADGSRWGGVRAYWTAEAGDKTNATPAFRQLEFNLKKLTGLAYVTDELLEDAGALEQVLSQAFAEEIGFKLDDAVIRGTGAGMPLGILASPALVTVAAEGGQDVDTVISENIMNMWSRMYAPSRTNAVWFIHQNVEPQLFRLEMPVALGGVPAYMPPGGLSASPYGTLFGKPVIPIEQADTLGDVGDIILADMGQYILVDKGGIQSAVSMHVRFTNDETVFRFVYRVDGQPWWHDDLTLFNSTTTVSPFIALAAR
jgi:HK97 family phage major capsid protein